MSQRNQEHNLGEIIALSLLALTLVTFAWLHNTEKTEECEKKGGTWLMRESKCLKVETIK